MNNISRDRRGAPQRRDARARVIATLAEAGPLSRTDLSRRAGLALSTVSTAVAELLDDGLVEEPGEVPAEGLAPEAARAGVGRPPVLVALHRRAGVALGVDLGRRHVRVALIDLAHVVLAERYRAFDGAPAAAEAASLVAGLAEEVLAEAGESRRTLVGIGMGLPAPLHRSGAWLEAESVLPGWEHVDVVELMSQALGRAVELDNDANLGALSEFMWGSGREARNMAYLKVATGIGAGLIIDGQPYRGSGGTAGEIGHIVVDPGGAQCRCGSRGCLETVAGSAAVLERLQAKLGEAITLEDAVERAQAGNPTCRRAIVEAARALGGAVAAMANLLNLDLIAVDGDFAEAGDLLLDTMREEVARQAIPSAAGDVELVAAELRPKAQVLGAVALVLRTSTASRV